jgi:anti-anti-sigma factor
VETRLAEVVGRYHNLVVDLSGLTFCVAAGLGMFVRLARQCAARGGTLRLAAPHGVASTVLMITHFGDEVPTYATLPGALAGDDRDRIARGHVEDLRARS